MSITSETSFRTFCESNFFPRINRFLFVADDTIIIIVYLTMT